MKYLLLLIIKAYWILIPASKRKHCLFKQSCSRYVFQEAKMQGLLKGLKALMFRYENCRPGYQLISIENETILVSRTSKVFSENEIDPRILLK
jgi:putative component of membrane protein insertase Oxa1/YidC/SpoIIIJ protein YidD